MYKYICSNLILNDDIIYNKLIQKYQNYGVKYHKNITKIRELYFFIIKN